MCNLKFPYFVFQYVESLFPEAECFVVCCHELFLCVIFPPEFVDKTQNQKTDWLPISNSRPLPYR